MNDTKPRSEIVLEWSCETCGWSVAVPAPGYAGNGYNHFTGDSACGPLVARRVGGYLRMAPGASGDEIKTRRCVSPQADILDPLPKLTEWEYIPKAKKFRYARDNKAIRLTEQGIRNLYCGVEPSDEAKAYINTYRGYRGYYGTAKVFAPYLITKKQIREIDIWNSIPSEWYDDLDADGKFWVYMYDPAGSMAKRHYFRIWGNFSRMDSVFIDVDDAGRDFVYSLPRSTWSPTK